MANKKKNRTTQWIVGALIVALIAMSFVAFNLSDGGGNRVTGQVTGDAEAPNVQCNKDFEKTISLQSRNVYEKAENVDTTGTVSYSVWKVVDENVDIPQDDVAESGSLTVGYGETFKVVADSNASDVRTEYMEFSVDENCNGPKDTVFYMSAIPSTLDDRFDSSKIDGANTDSNKVPLPQETTRTVEATFTGESKTSMDAIVVWDVNTDIIDDVGSSDFDGANKPESHTTLTNEKSYAFVLGEFDGSSDVEGNFDFTAEDSATTGAYNATYTVYQYQNGYVDQDTGNWVNEASIDDSEGDNALLATYTGKVYFDITT